MRRRFVWTLNGSSIHVTRTQSGVTYCGRLAYEDADPADVVVCPCCRTCWRSLLAHSRPVTVPVAGGVL